MSEACHGKPPHEDVLTATTICEPCLRGSPFKRVILRRAVPTIAPRVMCGCCGRVQR